MFIRNLEIYETLWRLSFGSGTKLFITFLSLRFFYMRRERHTQFLSKLTFLSEPHYVRHISLTPTGLAEARSKIDCLPLDLNLNYLFIFKSPKSSALPSFTSPDVISYLGFLLWHPWLSHPPRARVNTCAQCVHLTNPCTKRKVLSLTKPKNKIYKTKSLRNYITLGHRK